MTRINVFLEVEMVLFTSQHKEVVMKVGQVRDLMRSPVATGSGQGMPHHGAGQTGEQPQLIQTQ